MPKAFRSFDQTTSSVSPEKSRFGITRRFALFGGGVLLLASVTGIAGMTTQRPSVDAITGCLLEVPPPTTLSILVDASDKIEPNEISRTKVTVGNEMKQLPDYGRVILSEINASMPNSPKAVLAFCSPGVATGSNLFTGSIYAARTFSEKRERPVLKAIDDIAAKATPTISPIHESITALTRRPDFDGSVPNRRLVIVTDGLQNDRMPTATMQRNKKGYTHYSSEDPWRAFQRSGLTKRPGPDLRNTVVIVQYVERPEWATFQGQRHRDFWDRWFRLYGATKVEFRGVPLGPLY
ncbi:MAG: hypothetical protein ABIL01_09175 [Pseudomonadota bacterium]